MIFITVSSYGQNKWYEILEDSINTQLARSFKLISKGNVDSLYLTLTDRKRSQLTSSGFNEKMDSIYQLFSNGLYIKPAMKSRQQYFKDLRVDDRSLTIGFKYPINLKSSLNPTKHHLGQEFFIIFVASEGQKAYLSDIFLRDNYLTKNQIKLNWPDSTTMVISLFKASSWEECFRNQTVELMNFIHDSEVQNHHRFIRIWKRIHNNKNEILHVKISKKNPKEFQKLKPGSNISMDQFLNFADNVGDEDYLHLTFMNNNKYFFLHQKAEKYGLLKSRNVKGIKKSIALCSKKVDNK